MLKTVFKRVGLLLLLALVVFIALIIYRKMPSEAQKLRTQNNALGYVELLGQAKVSKPNPNVYASSQITPDNPLFKGVLALQQGRRDIADKELSALAEAGNVDAMYWYAETMLGVNVNYSIKAADLFVKAAELGNPYAALRLTPGTSDCKRYLGYRCSEEWVEKGEALLKARAEQGDVKAQYYANVRSARGSKADYDYNIALVTQAANQGYYMPLMEQISWLEEDKSLDDKKKQAIAELLTLAANNNFVPAMEELFFEYKPEISTEQFEQLRQQAAKLGARYAFVSYFETYLDPAESGNKQAQLDFYRVALLEKQYKGEIMRVFEFAEGDTFLALTKDEKQAVQQQVDEFISNMTPVIYIDELHTEYGKY
ncbi:hypothetical protein [uncultured Shewanella sp.]|uniref:hypothetical protein n=1 Tax=uncultured Shewanella sp. TaxID=173975 RepID=UPI002630AC33|nr:hypothetical protein [uncultured Shewanella sp.]